MNILACVAKALNNNLCTQDIYSYLLNIRILFGGISIWLVYSQTTWARRRDILSLNVEYSVRQRSKGQGTTEELCPAAAMKGTFGATSIQQLCVADLKSGQSEQQWWLQLMKEMQSGS